MSVIIQTILETNLRPIFARAKFTRTQKLVLIAASPLIFLYGVRLVAKVTEKSRWTAWEGRMRSQTVELVKGPTVEPKNPGKHDHYTVFDLGKALPIALAPDGSLLFARPEASGPDGASEWVHYLRNPRGENQRVGVGSFSLTTKGELLEAYDAIESGLKYKVAGKLKQNSASHFTNLFELPTEVEADVTRTNGTLFVSNRFGSHSISVWDDKNLAKQVPVPVRPDEPFWKAAGRAIGLFEPGFLGLAPGSISISSGGDIYVNLWQTDGLYSGPKGSSALPCRLEGDAFVPLVDINHRRFNTWMLVTPSNEVTLHEMEESSAQAWPCVLLDGEVKRLALPKGATYGKVVGSSGSGRRIVQAGFGPKVGATFLWISDHYVELTKAIPEVADARLSFEYLTWGKFAAKGTPNYHLTNPMAESGHFVAQKYVDGNTAHLLYFTPKSKSP